jgi:hypothetical protein
MVEVVSRSPAPRSYSGLGGEQRFRREIERVTACAATCGGWSEALKQPLRELYPYDAAWIAWRDGSSQRYVPVLTDGQTDALCAFFRTERATPELERLGFLRAGWPMVVHRAAVTLAGTSAWRDHLTPAGFRDGLGVGLFAPDGRQVGFLTLLTYRPHTVTATVAALLHTVNPLLGSALDRSFGGGITRGAAEACPGEVPARGCTDGPG